MRVRRRLVSSVQESIDGFGAFEIRERDRHDTQRIVDELAIRTLQRLRLLGDGAPAHELLIEHAGKRRQAFFALALFEQRPAVLVETLLVERGRGVARDDDVISVLRLGVLLRGEQQLAAAELHFIQLRGSADNARRWCRASRARLLGLARGFVSARELVEHLIVARVLRVGLQQRRIELDRLGALQVDGVDFASTCDRFRLTPGSGRRGGAWLLRAALGRSSAGRGSACSCPSPCRRSRRLDCLCVTSMGLDLRSLMVFGLSAATTDCAMASAAQSDQLCEGDSCLDRRGCARVAPSSRCASAPARGAGRHHSSGCAPSGGAERLAFAC